MPKLFDTLAAYPFESNTFTVITGGPLSVFVGAAIPNQYIRMRPGYFPGTFFKRGNNFNIVSVGYRLSEPFRLCKEAAEVGGTQGVKYRIYAYRRISMDLFLLASVNIPLHDQMVSVNKFIDVEDVVGGEEFEIRMGMADYPAVDMSNAPAAYNGKTCYMWPFIQIEYNELLIA